MRFSKAALLTLGLHPASCIKVGVMDIPGMYLHALKGDRKGEWAMTVSGNWRITLRFIGEDATEICLEDDH